MRYILASLVALALTVPAQAATVLSDNFNTENGGNSALNYSGFANFVSNGGGDVDLVKSGDFGITCSGSCVDLDGSPGPGQLFSSASYAFAAGDLVTLGFDVGGSQRGGAGDIFNVGFIFSGLQSYSNLSGTGLFSSLSGSGSALQIGGSTFVAGNAAFTTSTISFIAGAAGSTLIAFNSPSVDNVGPLLDNVSLDIAAVPEPATWAMMIMGFGLVGSAMRRRTRTLAAA